MPRKLQAHGEAGWRLGWALVLSSLMHLLLLLFPTSPREISMQNHQAQQASAFTTRLLIATIPNGKSKLPNDPIGNLQAKTPPITTRQDALPDPAPPPEPAEQKIYELDEVDVRPWIRTHVKVEYPPMLPLGIETSTTLSLLIDEQGRIADIKVLKGADDPIFDFFAVEAFSKASYTAALIRKSPVKVILHITVDFN